MGEREFGVLLHPSSLAGGHGIGDLGDEAHAFLDWLNSVGGSVWQILPLVPPGAGNSPYSTWSAFSVNPDLISLTHLARAGLLNEDELPTVDVQTRVDFAHVSALKAPLLNQAATRFIENGGSQYASFQEWRSENEWALDAARFKVLKTANGGKAWWDWEAPEKDRDAARLDALDDEYSNEIKTYCVIQYLFHLQWSALRQKAAALSIDILGDLPIYVDADSVDVWAARDQFQLNTDGTPRFVAGVPPDAFSATGQLWGNPLYDWETMHADGYGWWIRRLSRALSLTDRVRIDHFRGLSAYWAVPASAVDARDGAWHPGPRHAFFDAVKSALGQELPIVAEDLGTIDDDVVELVAYADVPNMLVLQFAFGGESNNWYLPHNHTQRSVVYTGTHDNDTTAGWWSTVDERAKHHVRSYFGVDGHDIAWTLIRAALASTAKTAIFPLQDVLGLGSEGRLNTPAVALGNWGWRIDHHIDHGATERLRGLARLYGRCPGVTHW